MTMARKWTLMAGLLVLVIFAAGWYLLIAPKRSEAAQLEAKAVSQEDANQRLAQSLAVLRAQHAELPQQEAYLALIRSQVPVEPALPSLIRNLTEAARTAGASLDVLTPGTPTAVVEAGAVAPVAATPAADASVDDAAGDVPAATPAAPLYQLPVALTVSGSYFDLEQFVDKLESLKRSFLVTGFSLTEVKGEKADRGKVTLTLTGSVFFAPATAAPTAVPTPAATQAAQ